MILSFRALRGAALALVLALPACGDLPQPYRGNPGGQAARLAAPPAYRLAVPKPAAALLSDAQAQGFAEALSAALLTAEVPASVTDPLPLDWRLTIEATTQGNAVVPRYSLTDPDGHPQGATLGARISAREWSDASPAVLTRVARDAAPRIADLLLRAEAALKGNDPAALLAHGPPRIYVPMVRGAPGDGNTALTVRIREALNGQGMIVQETAQGARFAVTGQVDVVNLPGNRTQRVELLWTISRQDGHDLGRVLQLNEVPAGVLNHFWGDVAFAAANEAAGGVQTVVRNAGGFPTAPDAPAAGATPQPGQGLTMPRDGNSLPTPRPQAAAATN